MSTCCQGMKTPPEDGQIGWECAGWWPHYHRKPTPTPPTSPIRKVCVGPALSRLYPGSIQALSRLYPIYIGSFYRLLLSRDNVKYHGSTRWSIIFSALINYTECQTITGVLWDSIGLYLDCKSSFLLRKTKIIYNLPTITLEAAYHDVLYLISFFYHQ